MEETFIQLIKRPPTGFPKGHLLANITIENKYQVIGRYMKSVQVVDDIGNQVWISNKLQKKFFKEAK